MYFLGKLNRQGYETSCSGSPGVRRWLAVGRASSGGHGYPTETAGEGRSQDRIQVLECLERTRNSDDGPLLPPPNLDPTAENDVASPRRVVSLREGLAERAPAEWEGKTGYAFPRVRRRGEKRSKRGSGTVIKTGTGW